MARTNKTRSALLTSVMALLLCISMLVGTTFAWFTDTASTGVNTIQSGNLDLVLEYRNAAGEWEEVTKDTLLFKDGALYEPGYTEVAYLRVSNAGSLALKYELFVNVANEVTGINKAGETFKLSDYIQFGTVTTDVGGEIGTYATREAAQAAVAENAKPLMTYNTENAVALAPAEAIEMALVVFMPTTVNNEANHNGVNVPSITMGVSVYATQLTYEDDSYGPDYDKDAGFIFDVRLTGETAGKHLVGAQDKVLSAYIINNNTIDNYTVHADVTSSGAASQVTGDSTFNNCVFVANGNNSFWANGVEDGDAITFNNCTFEAGIKLGGDSTNKYIFNNCSFAGETDWTKGLILTYAPVELNNCTFNRGTTAWYDVYKSVGLNTAETVKVTGGTVLVAGKATTTSSVVNELVSETEIKPTVASQDAFVAWIANNEPVIELQPGSYTMVNTKYDVTISGSKDAVLTLGSADCDNATINFKGITIQGAAPENKDDWVNTNQLKGATKATYENCTINNLITTFCPSEFTNCVFENEGKDQYAVFCYASSKITGCTFNVLSKAVKLYNNNFAEMTLDVSNCTFNGAEFDKAAIEIDTNYTGAVKYTVNITDCEMNEYYTKLWADKGTKSVVYVDGALSVAASTITKNDFLL